MSLTAEPRFKGAPPTQAEDGDDGEDLNDVRVLTAFVTWPLTLTIVLAIVVFAYFGLRLVSLPAKSPGAMASPHLLGMAICWGVIIQASLGILVARGMRANVETARALRIMIDRLPR